MVRAGNNNPETAVENMKNYNYVKAISIYTDYFKSNTPSVDDIRNITTCYLMTNNTKSAKEWISKLANSEKGTTDDILLYANLLKTESEYDLAIVQYLRYKTLVPSDKNVDKLITSCKNAAVWVVNPTFFVVTNVAEINTEYADFGMVPFKNGYVFTSDRKQNELMSNNNKYGWTGNPYLKLFQLSDAASLSSAIPVSDLNDKYHNGPGTYDLKHNVFFFTRTKMVRVTKKNSNNDPTSWVEKIDLPDYENRLEIFIARNVDGKWVSVEPFQYNRPEQYSVGHPAISPDGNTLYFVSDKPDGFGGTDIYSCERNANGSWKQPQNLGKTINSEGKEMFPFVDKDGTLYFSSDRIDGMGGLDIYKSSGKNKTWSKPENMESPINTSKDDFSIYFTEAGKTGFLSSNRYGGKGNDDIYSFKYDAPTQLILVVIPKEIGENNNLIPLDGVSIAIDNTTRKTTEENIKATNGTFFINANCDNGYAISGTKEGYFKNSKTIDTKCVTRNDTIYVDLVLEKIKINAPIVLKNIYYDFDKSFIRTDAMPDLDKVVQIMLDNPDIIVELGSHTDARGSDDYNIKLSQRRADAAIQYIISKGIDKKRITAKGYGETQHLNKCSNNVECSEEAHQLNRRTEFKVTGYIKGKSTSIKSDL